jgi:hypothetical protein
MGARNATEDDIPAHGVDWIAFLLAFRGVVLEGLEVAIIVATFGAAARAFPSAALAAAAALIVIGGAGALARRAVERIPRSALQLLVGTLLSAFGSFWAVEGLGIAWPGVRLDRRSGYSGRPGGDLAAAHRGHCRVVAAAAGRGGRDRGQPAPHQQMNVRQPVPTPDVALGRQQTPGSEPH